MKITNREKLDVVSQLTRDLSWKCFADFVEKQIAEKRNLRRTLSGDLNKMLEREQIIGQIDLLETIKEDFHSHVVNVITINKEEQNDNAE